MSAENIFATPQKPASISNCCFYHTMEIPGYGLVNGSWDLRPGMDRYLGHVDFRGKRVLDVGAANGYLTFHMEKNGAEVVSYDLSKEFDVDVAPSRYGHRRHAAVGRRHMEAVNNAYWLAHQALASRAKMVYGTVYDIPRAVGKVDIAVFGCILLHLRDPLLALQNALRLTTEKVIVVEPLWRGRHRWAMSLLARLAGPYMVFMPDYWKAEPQGTWWRFTPAIVTKFMAALGFEKTTVSYHRQMYNGAKPLLFTVVAERTQPLDDFGLDGSPVDA